MTEEYVNQERYLRSKVFNNVEPPGPSASLDFSFWYGTEGPFAQSSGCFPPKQTTYSYRTKFGGSEEQDPRVLIKQAQDQFLRPHDNGHEFSTERESFVSNHRTYSGVGYNGARYSGPLISNLSFAFMAGGDFDHRYHFSNIDPGVGTKYLALVRPTKSAANVAQALLELLVDMPKLPYELITRDQARSKYLKRGSGEYLNVVFGWQPLVQDVLKICRAIVYSNDIIQQYERDSGRQVRRRFPKPGFEQTPTFTTSSGPFLNEGTNFSRDQSSQFGRDLFASTSDSLGQVDIVDTRTEKYWLSAAYTYLSTGDDSFLGKMADYGRLANHVLGTRIDIDTLWQIAPWSWLSDWFTDIGGFIAINNSIAQDNLVIRYGYLMRESHFTRTWTHSGINFRLSGPTGPLISTYTRTKKERIRATPYGFGINPDVLTDKQWAILIALGLTKGDRKFWWG